MVPRKTFLRRIHQRAGSVDVAHCVLLRPAARRSRFNVRPSARSGGQGSPSVSAKAPRRRPQGRSACRRIDSRRRPKAAQGQFRRAAPVRRSLRAQLDGASTAPCGGIQKLHEREGARFPPALSLSSAGKGLLRACSPQRPSAPRPPSGTVTRIDASAHRARRRPSASHAEQAAFACRKMRRRKLSFRAAPPRPCPKGPLRPR